MKIGIDARFVGPQGTGLGKYTEKLILNLAQIDKNNDYSIFLRENNWSYLNLNEHKNFTKILADIPWYSLQEQYKLPGIVKAQNLDLLHVPHFNAPILYKGKFIVTIHDLIHHKFSETSATTKNPFTFKIKRFGYKKVIENAIYKSQKIITPSNFVKDDIAKNFKVEPSKIVVTYEAAEEEYEKISNFKFQISNSAKKNPFLMYVGNAYPHKNLSKLLDAMQILVRQHPPGGEDNAHLRGAPSSVKVHLGGESKLKLIIVSPRDVFADRLKEEIESRNLQKYVELKGYMNADELSKLFAKATAYVFPSQSEGFGIPGLNAMASGLPVISSEIPVLKEVYGNAALYFDPNDLEDIAKKIQDIISHPKTRSDLVKKGKAQVKKYSWRKMAEQTLEVYKKS